MSDDDLLKLMQEIDPETKRVPPGIRAIVAAALATARRQALEDAARVCEEVIEQDNESAYQAAAGNCAAAIRALMEKP